MTFFYDLNKRMAELSQKQTLAEHSVPAVQPTRKSPMTQALNERDMGKHNNATTGFAALAKKAGKEYGSKAAGERVAGAQFQKMKKAGKLEEQGMDEAVRGLFYGDQGWQAPTNQAQRDATAKDVKQTRASNRADTTVTGYGNRVQPQQGTKSASGLARRTQPSYGGQETPVDSEKTHPYYSNPKHLDNYGNLQIKPGQGKGVAGGPNMAEADMDESAVRIMAKPEGSQVTRGTAAYVPKNSIAGKTPQGQAHRDATAAMAKAARAAGGKLAMNKTTDVTGKRVSGGYDAMAKGVTPYRSSMEEEGGMPMTAKQKSFAALAPPKDKITFADKIAGAKKEVDEMLGDVAAEAMKSAVTKMHGTADMSEDFDDMMKDVKKRMGPRVGDVRRGARHDIETTATGVRATRRHDDETDEQPTGEKRRAGRPKGADKGPERVTARAYKHKGGRVKEDGMEDMIEPHDSGEYDREGEMAKDSIKTVVRHAQALEKILGDNDNLPEWVQSKLAKIESMMTAVDDYMQNQEGDDEMAVDEEKTSTRDSRAERAGRKVAKDIEYDEKKKDGIHGKRRGSEDDRAEKAGKRVTKDIESDEKKKEKKVAETTTSGSVATGGDAPKSTKGGVQIGKGIYDSLNRKLENMIAESMSINVSMTNDDNGSHKNITVTAADEDAESLAQLLRSAGLGGDMAHDHGHEEPCPDCGSTDCGCDDVCPDCGQSPCACDQVMDEAYGDTDASQNKPNWPTNTEYSDDAMQYSGGLNKPKASGMATIPVTDVQIDGMDKFGEINRLREMAGIKQQELQPWERTMKEEAVEEGVVDTVKGVVKKGLEKLGHGSDKDMIKDLQKKTGVPATGEKPADKKMEESLMQEFANFRI